MLIYSFIRSMQVWGIGYSLICYLDGQKQDLCYFSSWISRTVEFALYYQRIPTECNYLIKKYLASYCILNSFFKYIIQEFLLGVII